MLAIAKELKENEIPNANNKTSWTQSAVGKILQNTKYMGDDLYHLFSVSRFARNTVDALQNIRKLKEKGIPVIFEKEGVNTMESGGKLLITILSSQDVIAKTKAFDMHRGFSCW